MIDYKNYILIKISNILDNNNIIVENPPKEEMGDFSVPCFLLRNDNLKTPVDVSTFIVDNFVDDKGYFDRISSMGPYVNFYLDYSKFNSIVINEIINNDNYGSFNQGIKEDLLLEHTSINPNASPHIGRIRNSLIGDFISNLFSFVNYNVEKHYFVNDIGKQISLLLLAFEKYGNENTTFKDMLSLYVQINKDINDDPLLQEQAFNYLNMLENGDENIREKFYNLTKICIEGQKEIFSSLDIYFDVFKRESDFIYDGSCEKILKQLENKKVLKEDEDGRLYVDLSSYDIPTKNPVLVLTRKDKTSLYPLRDIAYTIYKINKNQKNNFIVLGEDQITYMKQIEAVMDILGYKAPNLISYSFVLLNGDKMATRDGKVVLLEDFMEIVKEKLQKEFDKRNIKVNDHCLKTLTNASIKYTMYNVSRSKVVNFNYSDALSFTGESGIYILYSIVRINSILNNNNEIANVDLKFENIMENKLIKMLYDFPYVINSLLTTFEPSTLTKYIYNLTVLFSSYYENVNISNEEDETLKNSRLALIKCIKDVLTSALKILGISTVEKM